MSPLLDLAYLAALLVLSPYLLFAACRHGKYLRGWSAKFLGRAPKRAGARRCVWLHGVSVGEINLLGVLAPRLARDYPDWEIVVSTTTRAGYDLARARFPTYPVFYAPLDFSWAARAALARVRPDVLLLAELELWPNLIAAAHARGVAVAVVNGRLGDNSFRGYRWIRWLTRRVLGRVSAVVAQNEEYAERFRALGAPAERVTVGGSLKFDGVETDRANPRTRRLAELAGIAPTDRVFVAGSTQAPEEELALAAFQALAPRFPELRLLIVPRHSERFDEVARLLARSGVAWRRRSELENAAAGAPPDAGARVLLVDTIGELGDWWGTADAAFVGGSLGRRGGQNMLEPAAYGAAVCFGPNTRNFRDIVSLLLAARGARVARDGAELTRFVEWCLTEPEEARAQGQRAQALARAHAGAIDATTRVLAPLFASAAAKPAAAASSTAGAGRNADLASPVVPPPRALSPRARRSA